MQSTDTSLSLFETENYLAMNAVRWGLASRVIDQLRGAGIDLSSAYDLGAGPGWFANVMSTANLDVVALEARPDVAAAASLSAPNARVEVFDLDAVALNALPPPRDFVLAFGILYHLENPLRALRIARALCGKAILLETMTLPDTLPMARVIRENPNPTQGFHDLALLLSPAAIEWGLWGAGFRNVYRFTATLDHADFRDTAQTHRRRHIWLASESEVSVDDFEAIELKEPRRADFWRKG